MLLRLPLAKPITKNSITMKDYKFVDINGKKYPLRFGLNALRKYGQRTNTTLADLGKIGDDISLENSLQLIYAGIEDGYRKAKQKCELTIECLADLIDDDFEAITRCMEVLSSQIGKENQQSEDEKKEKPKKVKE
jgi:hypothetical protein